MKIEHNNNRAETSIKAYLTASGALVIRNSYRFAIGCDAVMMETDGDVHSVSWDETEARGADAKFYEGDSVTLTF